MLKQHKRSRIRLAERARRSANGTKATKGDSGKTAGREERIALRQSAEAFVGKPSKTIKNSVAAGTRTLVSERWIQQVELELQNKELRKAQSDLEISSTRFAELFDFAPVGYLTLDSSGTVLEANLAASEIAGVPRSELIYSKLSPFIAAESRQTYYLHRQEVFATARKQTCEVVIRKRDGTSCIAELQSLVDFSLPVSRRHCRTIVTDITARKQAEATWPCLPPSWKHPTTPSIAEPWTA